MQHADPGTSQRLQNLSESCFASDVLVILPIPYWACFESFDSFSFSGIIIMLVGNKADQYMEEGMREVKTEEGLEFSQRNKLLFMETSAKDNLAVADAFEKLIRGTTGEAGEFENSGVWDLFS